MSIVGFSGGLSDSCRSSALAQAIVDELVDLNGMDHRVHALAECAAEFGSAISRNGLGSGAEAILQSLEHARILVVTTPVYRAAYPGLFKHVFDLLERASLKGKVVVLGANGGGAHHALMIESHLRPLVSSLGAFTAPTGIFTQSSDFSGNRLVNPAIACRISEAVAEARVLAGQQSAIVVAGRYARIPVDAA